MNTGQCSTFKCAVLLAAYNGIQYIAEQVESIFQQINVDVMLFISVDLSTDGTLEWVTQLAKENSNVKLLPYGERFGGAAKNFFRLIKDVDLSSFDYVAFADQDDRWNLDKLARAINVLKDSDYSAYSSNVIAFWPDGKQRLVVKSQPQTRYDFIFEGAGPGCTYVIDIQLMSKIKEHMLLHWDLLQEVWLHDWFCYAFARTKNYKWFIDPVPSMDYRQHINNQIGAKKGLKAYLSRFRYIRSGFWFKQILLIARLVEFKSINFNELESFNRSKLLSLSFKARQCRRRKSDQLFFFFICWLMILLGHAPKI